MAAREGRLDALVCNAGINIRKPIARLTLAEWSRVIGTNLTSTFLLTRAGEAMLRAAKGSVVTIASTRAHMSEADTEAYAASKGGLVALTHALSISLAPDVRVNCISPGWIFTKGEPPRPEDHAFHPAGRVGTPEDIAALVGVSGGAGERLHHRRRVHRRWRRDAEDDLSGVTCRSPGTGGSAQNAPSCISASSAPAAPAPRHRSSASHATRRKDGQRTGSIRVKST